MYLVIKKTSQLDIRSDSVGSLIERGVLEQEQVDRFETAHEEHVKTYNNLIEELEKHNIEYTEVVRGEKWPEIDNIKAVITVGGDGTVLEASHQLENSNVGLIGVRSSSMSVGYLCYITEKEISGLGRQLKTHDVNFVPVERIYAKVEKRTGEVITSPPVLNDFLYTNKNPAETTRYVFSFGDEVEVHKSSGIWISTAAGSTAAAAAAGGKVYPIEHRAFQFVIREPYCPPGGDDLRKNSEFEPEKNSITIENRCESALLALDGHHGLVELEMGDRISFERANKLQIARKSL